MTRRQNPPKSTAPTPSPGARSLAISGEEGAEAMIDRIQRRTHQWKDGCFPLRTATLQ
jgi:hypothetical protein